MATITTGYTNIGSLGPTSFPSDCLQSLWAFHTSLNDEFFSYLTQGCAASTCCPSGNFYTESWGYVTSYYSPGVCPSQYYSCPLALASTSLPYEPGETVVFCCPTNYGCPVPTQLFCQSPMLFSTTTYFEVDNIFDQKTTGIGTIVNSVSPSGIFVLAFPIQIRNSATETGSTSITSFTSNIASATTTDPALTSSPTSNIASATSTTSNSHGSKISLSGGAIAGITIGAFLGGGFILLAFGFFLYRPVLHWSNFSKKGSGVHDLETTSKPELDGQGSTSRNIPVIISELEDSHIST
jgi:hypothetical protein